MRLSDLLRGIVPAGRASLGLDPDVLGIARDSRAVAPGDLFVAVPGTRVDGTRFAAQAVAQGAVAVVAERAIPDLPAPVLIAPDAALALGLLADRLHGSPSREVAVTGVTGTNGKTTTTFLLDSILRHAGRSSALLGTVTTRVGGVERAATMTTPDVLDLHQALADARAAGERDLVMEVSSHALEQRRVAGVRYRCAVFTNLTRDHLDYHGSLAAYGAAKARLFTSLDRDATAVLNALDPFARRLAPRTQARVVTYGWAQHDPPTGVAVGAGIRGEGLFGTRLVLRLAGETLPLELPLVGRFNAENALAAAAAAYSLGVEPRQIRDALEATAGVPGRLERIQAPNGGPTVLVDYAHTPDALERVLTTLRPLLPRRGRLIAVFGCGGDRDRGKRAPMGRAVARHADLGFLTNDNPRSEAPTAIAHEVLRGCGSATSVRVVLDRQAAIARAISAAGPDDLVLVAGKGHEQEQVIGERRIPFDDRRVARQVLLAA